MKEVVPGVHHWSRTHPKIGIAVSSYYLPEERVLIDPLWPDEGMDAFETAPTHILLTNRHHYRDSARFVEQYGCTVSVSEAGLHEFADGRPVLPFAVGDTLAGGIEVHPVAELCPDEVALWIPRGDGLLAIGDGIVRRDDGPLGFVPDAFMGEHAEQVKTGLKRAYSRLIPLRFDHLLLAHGWPWIGGGKPALLEFSG